MVMPRKTGVSTGILSIMLFLLVAACGAFCATSFADEIAGESSAALSPASEESADFKINAKFESNDNFTGPDKSNQPPAAASGEGGKCCEGYRDDPNGDGITSISDVVFLVEFVFHASTPPDCYDEGNVNGDEHIDSADFIFLMGYMSSASPALIECYK